VRDLGERRRAAPDRDHLSHSLVYVGLGEREAVALLLVLASACAGVGVLVVAFNDALVTGGGTGGVFALLVGVGSRLALVTEPRVAVLPVSEHQLTQSKLEPLRDHAHAS
jgi:hypothetical protein